MPEVSNSPQTPPTPKIERTDSYDSGYESDREASRPYNGGGNNRAEAGGGRPDDFGNGPTREDVGMYQAEAKRETSMYQADSKRQENAENNDAKLKMEQERNTSAANRDEKRYNHESARQDKANAHEKDRWAHEADMQDKKHKQANENDIREHQQRLEMMPLEYAEAQKQRESAERMNESDNTAKVQQAQAAPRKGA